MRQSLDSLVSVDGYDDEVFADFLNSLHTYHEPHDLLRVAFARAPESRPGEKFVYANTNYILAGLLVQKVTGRPVGEQITKSEPSGGWAAGALIGPPSDINRFLAGLLGGKLLKPAELAEMQKTVDAPGFDTVGGSHYGLGIATFNLSCGGFAWTHGGIAPGYVTYVGVVPSGKAASIAVTSMVAETSAAEHLDQALDTALGR